LVIVAPADMNRKILSASFKKALELNVDAIELDVHALKTGELVVIHDSTVDRTTNGKGYVSGL
jgi:glycerophosphoryl diester phosphodiesterase